MCVIEVHVQVHVCKVHEKEAQNEQAARKQHCFGQFRPCQQNQPILIK